jgi:NDMA-dependent alcohol dehydrogenase
MRPPKPGARERFEVVDIELDEPGQDELLVRMVAAGLCHSDDHMLTGDVPPRMYPFCVGHEGAGIVEQVGRDTLGYEVGDHVVFTFIPVCGRCRWCAVGLQNLCDLGKYVRTGTRPDDSGTFRMHLPDGTDVGQTCGVSTFSELTTVHISSAIKIDREMPLDRMCLLGCGVGTGWGAAVNSASAEPGDTIIVMGVGGVGINAVQGAAQAGASNVIAVDPVAMKRHAALKLGATHAYADIAAAADFARSVTNGQGADSAIVTVGVVRGEHVAEAFAAIRKAGTVVVTGLGDSAEVGIPVSLGELTLMQKRIQGSLYGSSRPTFDVPRQVEMYRAGRLKLDELITSTYTLDQVNQGYDDMHAGRNIRGVIMFS